MVRKDTLEIGGLGSATVKQDARAHLSAHLGVGQVRTENRERRTNRLTENGKRRFPADSPEERGTLRRHRCRAGIEEITIAIPSHFPESLGECQAADSLVLRGSVAAPCSASH